MSKRKRPPHDKESALLPPDFGESYQAPPSRSFLGRLFSRKDNEAALRAKIEQFTFQPRFSKDVERALRLYFGKKFKGRTLAIEEEEMPGFQEWWIHDFAPSDGQRLIDRFAEEVGPSLPEAEAKLLAAWRAMNRLRLFEVQSVQPGTGVVVRDLLNDETLTINDRSASRSMRRWMVILARPHQAEDRVCFTGSSPALTPRDKQEMMAAAQQLWNDYKAQRPEAALLDFYRDRSLDLLRAMWRLQEEAMRPPTVLTAEGHALVHARAVYAVRDAKAVAERLDEAEEFNYAGPSNEHPGAEHYNWLLRGRSRVPEKPMPDKGAVALKTDWSTGSGQPVYRSLGDITLGKGHLELECMSRERLEAGKALLAEVLGDLVKHRRDRVKPFKLEAPSRMERDEAPLRPRPRLSRQEQALAQELLDQYTAEWLETPIPALNHLSPRQAVKTPEGRAEISELLKYLEYLDDERRERGDPATMDLARIKRELGLG